MLHSSSGSESSAVIHGNHRPSLAAADAMKIEGFGKLKQATKTVLIEIKRREAVQLNAGWITMDELKASTGMERADLIEGLKDLFGKEIIETLPGNGQGNNRYRMLKKPVGTIVEKVGKTVHPIVIKNASEQPKINVKDEASGPQDRKSSPMSSTADSAQGVALTPPTAAAPEKSVLAESKPKQLAGVVRGPRGHFVSKMASAAQLPSLAGAPIEDHPNTLARSPALPAPNKIIQIQDVSDGLVLGLERRPGGSSIFLSLAEAIEIGSRALRMKNSKSEL